MKIVVATDAWLPQINGVVRTLGHTADQLRQLGHDVLFITPQDFRICPAYPSTRLIQPAPDRSCDYFRAGASDRGRGIGLQFSRLSCSGLHGKSEEFLFGYCVRDTDIDIGDLRDETHENLLTL